MRKCIGIATFLGRFPFGTGELKNARSEDAASFEEGVRKQQKK